MPNWNKQSRQEGSLKIFAFFGCPDGHRDKFEPIFWGNVRKRERSLAPSGAGRSKRNNRSESREAGRANNLTIFAKRSSDFFKKSPHLRILERLGVPQKGRDEGKDLCEALFELAKKLPEKKEYKVAGKRKNLKKGN